MDAELHRVWEGVQTKLLFRQEDRGRHPYYISAPHWIRSSAGIRALYLLCHSLNRLGFEAYITNQPYGEYHQFHPWTSDELMAPMLTKQRAEEHFEQRLSPIMLYSEVISGNPLAAPLVARWVMNFPGLLGGDTDYDAGEICYGYSMELATAAGYPDQVLHMPTIDTRIFYPLDEKVERRGGCFFASKYQVIHKGELYPITSGCFEITRQRPDSLKPREVADLFRRSSVFYAYENTALATEAVLCGCPAVFIPNPHLTEIIGRDELGADGYAWGTQPEEIERARATVAQGAINYLKTYDLFWNQLEKFIDVTQSRAQMTPYSRIISIPSWPELPPAQLIYVPSQPAGSKRSGLRRQLRRVEKGFRPIASRMKHLCMHEVSKDVSSSKRDVVGTSDQTRTGLRKHLHRVEKKIRPFTHLLKNIFITRLPKVTSSAVKE